MTAPLVTEEMVEELARNRAKSRSRSDGWDFMTEHKREALRQTSRALLSIERYPALATAYQAQCVEIAASNEARAILKERIRELEAALSLILPMAKGYAAKNQVGSNAEYIEIARKALGEVSDGV